MKETRKCKHWLLHMAVFTALFVGLFVHVSYVMRNYADFDGSIRYSGRNIKNFSQETAPLDMVFIGGSSTYAYWIPLQAYGECGISSYNYSGNSMSPVLIKNLIIESRKHQTAKLYLIDLRAFDIMQHSPAYYSEEYLRGYTDAIPYSFNRCNMIRYALDHSETEPKNLVSVYLDLIYYHGNWRMLDKTNFQYKTLPQSGGGKGFAFNDFPPDPVVLTDYSKLTMREPLSPKVAQTMRDLLDYCKAEELNVLFYINPFSIHNENVKMLYNSIEDMIGEYGYPFIDANDHYSELALDPDTDFYNVNHVNVLGAQKYTAWMTRYITEHYDLPDHRGEAAYASWNTELAEYYVNRDAFITTYCTKYGLDAEETP